MSISVPPVAFQHPFSIMERMVFVEEMRIPATFEEYLEFAEQAEFKVEYSEGKIVSMGEVSAIHEEICANIGGVFNSIFDDTSQFHHYGSNLGILIEPTGAHYLPDASIILGEPVSVRHLVRKRTLKSFVNSYAVMEVFSEGTMDYDLTEKLPNYKMMPTLRYIIYIHRHKPFVTVFSRNASDEEWIAKDYRGMGASFFFEGQNVELGKLYRRVVFVEKKYDEEEE